MIVPQANEELYASALVFQKPVFTQEDAVGPRPAAKAVGVRNSEDTKHGGDFCSPPHGSG